ncbi:hypothetical protein ACJMK2_012046 [Sinanodonta woodiana]|uniref:Uncharacterized protein n=1 Tax=Sinanodonta woodiana TaxID=1069815 RepID=A0ABD3V8K2_SINWO
MKLVIVLLGLACLAYAHENTTKAPKNADGSVNVKNSEIPQIPDMSAMLGMFEIPLDASLVAIQNFVMEKAKEMGFDLSNPEKLKETLKDQLKTIMPGVNVEELIEEPHKALQTTLKGLGIPSDDPKAMKKLVQDGLKEMGIDNVDIDNMDDLVEKLKKKVFHMLDIDENEDPEKLKKIVKKQIFDQLQEMGIDVKEDDNVETVQKKLTSAISKELKIFGIEIKSDDPKEMTSAIKKKLNELGVKFDNMQELQNQIMGMFMQHAQSAFMNMMVPRPKQDRSTMNAKKPQNIKAPHFIPQIQYPNLNLEIVVNVEEEEDNDIQQAHTPSQFTPIVKSSKFVGADEIITDHSLSFGEDIMQHVMHVRSGLRSGSMSEDIIEEMLDDLLHYHLKNIMLKEKLDRIERANGVMHNDDEMIQGGYSRFLSAIVNH